MQNTFEINAPLQRAIDEAAGMAIHWRSRFAVVRDREGSDYRVVPRDHALYMGVVVVKVLAPDGEVAVDDPPQFVKATRKGAA